MSDPIDEDEPRGKVDTVAVLYIVGGIPAIFGFLVVFFSAVKAFDVPG